VVATNLDITERKMAEDERLKNLLLLEQSERLAKTGSWDYDLLTGVFTWSDGMYRLFDFEKGGEVSPDIYLMYVTEDSREAAHRVVDLIKSGKDQFEETLQLKVGGDSKIIKIKAIVLADHTGKLVRVLGVDMDVTAVQAAEAKIKTLEAEQQLEIFRVTLAAQEEERRRIPESLHNGLGQLLYGIKISMSNLTLKNANALAESFQEDKAYTESLLVDAISESRRISHELMPTTLEEFGLRSAIDDVCRQLTDAVKFQCHYRGLNRRLEKYLELAIFRTVQELMLNVVKHAQATEAKVLLNVETSQVTITVQDNGRGMPKLPVAKAGIGLASIRSKIKLLNGNVTISEPVNGGTIVEVEIPVPNAKL
jgi:signal transduction histidine kinase